MGAPIVRELLRKENYAKWAMWMKTYLMSKGLWGIVVGTKAKPEVPEQLHDWEMKNGKALHAILVSCEDEILPIISEVDSAKDAWDEIWAFMVPHHSSVVHLQGPSTSAGTSNDENTWRHKLYEAVVKDDWVAAKCIIDDDHWEALMDPILMDQTLLHTAVLHNHVDFVKKLLNEIMPKHTEITLPNRGNFTALHLAVIHGNLEMVTVLVCNNPNLLYLKDKYDRLPLTIASFMGNEAVVKYLRSGGDTILGRRREFNNQGERLIYEILEEDYGNALDLYKRHGQSPFAKSYDGLTPLEALAGKPSAYTSGNQLKFWQRWIYKCVNVPPNIEGGVSSNGNDDGSILSKAANWLRRQCWDAAKFITAGLIEKIYDMKLNDVQGIQLLAIMSDHISNLDDSEIDEDIIRNAMETAYRFGNAEFIDKMYSPSLLRKKVIRFRFIQNAIAYRQERIWATIFYGSFLHILKELSGYKSLLNEVAKLPPSSQLNKVSGPAMQMQRELQWFKEVETRVKPCLRGQQHFEIMTARELFTKEHKDLIKEAEKWMKETSASCMVVTTLIATVMFAAAFTVPGGNDGQKGIPIFLPETSFLVFIIADALSLFSSTASILMFLSILTSRFAEEYFLESLPKKLIIGLATLFFSIATMMVAFSATIVIVLHERYKWVAIPVSLFASVPITLFVSLQLPLFVDMVLSTYGPSIFRKKRKSKSVFDLVLALLVGLTDLVKDAAHWIVKCLVGPAPEAQNAEPQSAEDQSAEAESAEA